MSRKLIFPVCLESFLLLFVVNLGMCLGQEFFTSEAPGGLSTTPRPSFPNMDKWFNPEVFSRLTLPPKSLFGSRWVLENKSKMNVSHSIEVVDLTLFHTNELTLKVEFNLRQRWHAPDLEFPVGLFKDEDHSGQYITTDYSVLAHMWSPDSYVATSRESNMNTVGMPLSLVYIFKNKTIIYKVRMYTKIACTSSFQWYPLDIQNCQLVIESYKYHDDIVDYHWTPDNLYRPVILHAKRFFQYELRDPYHFDSGVVERGGRGTRYPFVRLKFTFERRLGNNIIQVYTPTTLVVVLSWFSFWLGLDAIPGRISLLVTCMLTLVTMHSGIKSTIPPVHYCTMLDVWLVSCMAFVFTAMCEFVVVKYLHWRQLQRQKVLERKMQEENREKLYSIMQNMGGMNSSNGDLHNRKTKVRPGVLPYASEKQNLYWNSQSPKVMPVDILRTIVVEAVARENAQDYEKDEERQEQFFDGNSEIGGNLREDDKMDNESLDDEKGSKMFPIWVKIDRICRACFPTLFCCFNVVYWPILFCGSQEPDTRMHGIQN